MKAQTVISRDFDGVLYPTPANHVVDSIDVIGTRWDGPFSNGTHRLVCLSETTPDERSELKTLFVFGPGGAIAIPSVDADVQDLTDCRVAYAQGRALQPP
jgi:hypothetical protein